MSIHNEQTKCPECGGTTTSETFVHLEQIHCDVCDWSQASTVYPEGAVDVIDENPELVNVRIEWSDDEAKPNEVVIARRTFETLANKPLRELLNQAKKSATYDLGTHILPLAIELQEQGKANGLRVSFSRISE